MFSYVILHYKNINETITCLNNLKSIVRKDSKLIVVDNNTLNSSEEKLIIEYTNDIIKLDRNYGFAKANNIGINYAKNKYKSKFYVVINNDVFITQDDFEKIILDDYEKYRFDMLGPKIFSPTNESVNPFPALKTKENVIATIKYCKKLIFIYKNPLLTFFLNNYMKLKKKIKKTADLTNADEIMKNVPLHGCCIIFSKEYVRKYSDPFFNDTFLFFEEEFLFQRIIKHKLISIYDNNLKVFHEEGASVKKINKTIRECKLFREEKKLESLLLLKEYMDK